MDTLIFADKTPVSHPLGRIVFSPVCFLSETLLYFLGQQLPPCFVFLYGYVDRN
jgi:hypothetical protein